MSEEQNYSRLMRYDIAVEQVLMTEDDYSKRVTLCLDACAGIPSYQLTAEEGEPTDIGEMIDHLRKERDELQALMRMIASVSHMGGLEKMSESEAMTAIRRATITYFDVETINEQHRSSIRSMKGGA